MLGDSIQRVGSLLCTHAIISRVMQAYSRVAQQHVRQLVHARGLVLSQPARLANSHIVSEIVGVLEQVTTQVHVYHLIAAGIYGSARRHDGYCSAYRVIHRLLAGALVGGIEVRESACSQHPEAVVGVRHRAALVHGQQVLAGDIVVASVSGVVHEQHPFVQQIGKAVLRLRRALAGSTYLLRIGIYIYLVDHKRGIL